MQEKSENLEPLKPNLELFNAISDETRLKILMILSHSEFTVNELKEILDIHQSNASRHLSKLSACGLLKDRREGTKAFYGLSDDLYMSSSLYDMISKAWEQLPDRAVVESKVEELLISRRNNYSAKFHKLSEAGGSLRAQISLFAHLMVQFDHAIDIGCGEGGDLSFMLAGRCKKVTAIDISETTVKGVNEIARNRGFSNIKALCADMRKIPLPTGCADLVLMSQVLHHAPSPQEALAEAIRLLKPGAILALLDLAEHHEEELRETHGHLWLGFSEERIRFLMQNLPCKIVETEIIQSEISEEKKLPAICIIVKKNA